MVIVRKEGIEYECSGIWSEQYLTHFGYGHYFYYSDHCGNSAVGYTDDDLFRPTDITWDDENGRFRVVNPAKGVEIVKFSS